MACLRIHAMRVQTLLFLLFRQFFLSMPPISRHRGHHPNEDIIFLFVGNSKRTFKLTHFALQKYDIFLKYASYGLYFFSGFVH